jgi:hypothetical protein
MMTSQEEYDELDKKFQKLLDKYKEKPLITKKLKTAIQRMGHGKLLPKDLYQKVAKLTSKIKYGCYFDGNSCKSGVRDEMCCCSNCGFYFGHFHERFFGCSAHIDYIEEELFYYINKYQIKHGFWRKGVGCILPRKRRSITCLTHNCGENFSIEERIVISILYDFKWEKQPSYIHNLIELLKDHFLYKED